MPNCLSPPAAGKPRQWPPNRIRGTREPRGHPRPPMSTWPKRGPCPLPPQLRGIAAAKGPPAGKRATPLPLPPAFPPLRLPSGCSSPRRWGGVQGGHGNADLPLGAVRHRPLGPGVPLFASKRWREGRRGGGGGLPRTESPATAQNCAAARVRALRTPRTRAGGTEVQRPLQNHVPLSVEDRDPRVPEPRPPFSAACSPGVPSCPPPPPALPPPCAF